MKRFLIHVDTNWCGEEDTFRAVTESEIELWDIAEEEGYDPDEMTDEDWDEMWSRIDETAYYSFSIEECEDDEEWNEYNGEIYGKDS